MLFTINIRMLEERVGTGFLLSPHCCYGRKDVSRGGTSSAGGRCSQPAVVYCQSCDPRLPHFSDILRRGENIKKISSQTLIEKTKQKSVAFTVMALVTKMDCSLFKISRVTCLQETCVFGQEDAPGLCGKQSKAGLLFLYISNPRGNICSLLRVFVSH